ncbi:MAG: tetratricopeptide repeat protein [Deltaproteobacteria bacterium]|nr:tetratricopeptide repeat protein [Deltaproteobacteria bacterium]
MLTDAIHDQIKDLCEEGDVYAEEERWAEAIAQYSHAWQLVPEPKEQFEATTWILAALGDANFLRGAYPEAQESLSFAMRCPGAIGNPFIHLRLGQTQLELQNLEGAADELARAYMGAGHDIFRDEAPKYFAFIKTRMKPPPGGWEA